MVSRSGLSRQKEEDEEDEEGGREPGKRQRERGEGPVWLMKRDTSTR